MTTAPSWQSYLAMNAAHPMDNQNDLRSLLIDVGNHLLDNGAYDTLLQPSIGLGIGPDGFEIGCECGERCRVGDRRGVGDIVGGNFALDLRYAHERIVPDGRNLSLRRIKT